MRYTGRGPRHELCSFSTGLVCCSPQIACCLHSALISMGVRMKIDEPNDSIQVLRGRSCYPTGVRYSAKLSLRLQVCSLPHGQPRLRPWLYDISCWYFAFLICGGCSEILCNIRVRNLNVIGKRDIDAHPRTRQGRHKPHRNTCCTS